MKHIQRQQFSFTNTSIKVSLKILVYVLSRLPGFCFFHLKMNSRQENRSKLSFTARIITKYSLERLLSICSEKMSKGFLKFYKLIIKPDTRSDRSLPQILQTLKHWCTIKHWYTICVQYQSSCATKLARKCEIEHCLSCGADGRAGGRCTVTWLPNFLGWVDLLTHGAPQARFACQSSAIMLKRITLLILI